MGKKWEGTTLWDRSMDFYARGGYNDTNFKGIEDANRELERTTPPKPPEKKKEEPDKGKK